MNKQDRFAEIPTVAKNCGKWLDEYHSKFRSSAGGKPVELTLKWKNDFPDLPGVYVVYKGKRPVYAGETRSLRKRMNHMRQTYNHTLRRSIGNREFSDEPGYEKATSKKKFTDDIEKLVDEYMRSLKVIAISIHFGRKEIEEHLVKKLDPIYNHRNKRGS